MGWMEHFTRKRITDCIARGNRRFGHFGRGLAGQALAKKRRRITFFLDFKQYWLTLVDLIWYLVVVSHGLRSVRSPSVWISSVKFVAAS